MNLLYQSVWSTVCIILGSTSFNNLHGQNINKHRWVNRILIIHTKDQQTIKYISQLEEFENSIQDFKERKLVLYQYANRKFKYTDYCNANNQDSWNDTSKPILTKLKEGEDFKIVLIGLDGGIKLEQSKVLRKDDLYQLIDSMPMRRSEIRNEE